MKATVPRPIHYSGGVLYRSGPRGSTELLPGWPACCSGDRARKIAAAREQSDDQRKVTCARCLELIRRHREDAAELDAHRPAFRARLAFYGLQAVDLETVVHPRVPMPDGSIADAATALMVRLVDSDTPDGGAAYLGLSPREAVRLGRVLVAWGDARGGGRAR